jgi:hypothetical protein
MQLMMLVFVCYILILYHLISEMKRFFVPRASIENVSVVQSEAEVEEPPPNLANEFNSNEIVRDSGLMKQGCTLFSCCFLFKNSLQN